MKLTVTARHIADGNDTEKLKNYAAQKANRIEKYIDTNRDPSELKFILSSEKFRDTAEITINSGHTTATTTIETDDMFTAIDSAVDTLITQLKKQTEKKISTKRRSATKSKEEQPQPTDSEDSEITEVTSIRVHQLPSKPMSVEEATLQLKVSDANFVAFRNSESSMMNVIYLNRRGQIILIEP